MMERQYNERELFLVSLITLLFVTNLDDVIPVWTAPFGSLSNYDCGDDTAILAALAEEPTGTIDNCGVPFVALANEATVDLDADGTVTEVMAITLSITFKLIL
jgi:hypothetical protein